MQDENQPRGATGGGREGTSDSAASGRCFSCTKGQLGLPMPLVPALRPGPGCGRLPHCCPRRCGALTLTRILQTNASRMLMCTCFAPSHTHLARSHLTHTSHKLTLTHTSCTSVPSLLPGMVSGLSSTPPREKPDSEMKDLCLLQIFSLACQETVQWDKKT